MVAALLEHETVEGDEVKAILAGTPFTSGSTDSKPKPPSAAAPVTDPNPERPESRRRIPPTISPEPA